MQDWVSGLLLVPHLFLFFHQSTANVGPWIFLTRNEEDGTNQVTGKIPDQVQKGGYINKTEREKVT